VRRVAVIGTGVIGASWTAYFLERGLHVTATDPAPGAEDALYRFVEQARASAHLEAAREGDSADGGAWRERLRFVSTIEEAVDGAEVAQENGPERVDVKADLFARMDAAAAPNALLASSSSGLLMTPIQARCTHPERCLIAHPFNPPHIVPLVEIVGGEQTSATAIEAALGFYRSIGKHPIHVRRPMPGHIANRLQAALWREAFYLVEQDVASVADVDAAIAYGPGLRWALYGPIALQHLSGGDAGLPHVWKHLMPAVQDWWKTLGTPDMTGALCDKLTAGVREELGDVSLDELERRRDRGLRRVVQAARGESDA
jgi:3-hydroxyacyl-CoA dehydrogenase